MTLRIASCAVYKWLVSGLCARSFAHRTAAVGFLFAVLFMATLGVAATSTWVGNTSANWGDALCARIGK